MPAERDREVSRPAAEVPLLTGWAHPGGKNGAGEGLDGGDGMRLLDI